MNVIRLVLLTVAMVASGVLVAAPANAAEKAERTTSGFRMASLNLKHTMTPRSRIARSRPEGDPGPRGRA